MRRWVCVAALLGGGAAIAFCVELSESGSPWTAVVLLGAAIAAGELIELHPLQRSPLPISFAYMIVLGRAGSLRDCLVVLVVAEATAALARDRLGMRARAALILERVAEGAVAVLAYSEIVSTLPSPTTGAGLVLAFAAAGVAVLAAAEVARMVRERSARVSFAGRTADLALITSAILMGISAFGVDGSAGMGIWGPVIFTIPLLAAWYSYEHLAGIRRTYDQTIRALGSAPELGGIVRAGHAERVASLAVEVGGELGLARPDLADLETAALLHHLGQVCVDEPEDGRLPEPVAVAEAGAGILRSTALLAPAGDIIAAETAPHREWISNKPSVVAGQVLKVSSAFDELSEGDPRQAGVALEALYSAPGYLYDGRALAALEIVLDRAGLLDSPS